MSPDNQRLAHHIIGYWLVPIVASYIFTPSEAPLISQATTALAVGVGSRLTAEITGALSGFFTEAALDKAEWHDKPAQLKTAKQAATIGVLLGLIGSGIFYQSKANNYLKEKYGNDPEKIGNVIEINEEPINTLETATFEYA